MPATNATKPMMRPIVPIPGMTIEFSSGTENTKRQSSHNATVVNGLSLDEDPENGRTTLAARRIRGFCLFGNMFVREIRAYRLRWLALVESDRGTAARRLRLNPATEKWAP